MTYKVVLTMALAAGIGFSPAAHQAFAADTVLSGTDTIGRCSRIAAQVETTGVATSGNLSVCNDAVGMARRLGDLQAETYVNRSVIHLARQEYDAAVADSDSALRIAPMTSQALVNRGIALSAEKRNAEAADAFTRAIALNPVHPETVYFNRALVREDSGDMKGAYLDYRKAAQLAPTWDTPKQQLARFSVAHSPIS